MNEITGLEEKKLRKKILLAIAKWYLLSGVILILIGFGAAVGDYWGFWQTQTNLLLSASFGLLSILGAFLLIQGVIFVILGISKRKAIT